MKKRKTKRPIKDRAFELDFVRGLCITLMMLEHFAVACYFFWQMWLFYIPQDGFLSKFLSFVAKVYFSEWKDELRLYVVAAFFAVAGLSVVFSRKKFKSLLKTSLFAGGLTAVTFLLSALTGTEQFLVTHGVFHIFVVCYIVHLLITLAVKDKHIRSAIFLTSGIFFILLHVRTEDGAIVWNDGFISALFVEKPYFISYLDNFFIIPWLGFFLLGAAAAPVLYPDKKSLLPRLNTELNSPVKAKNLPLKIIVKPINYIGRHPIFFYAFNIAVSVLFMFLIGLIFIGTEWIADLLGVI